MHDLQHVPTVRSVAPSRGEGTGSAKRPRNHVEDRGSEEEMHDQVTGEVERNQVKHSEKEMEDDGRGAAVERRPRDETTDTEDDDTLEDGSSGDEETSEDDDDRDAEELSGTTLHSNSTQWSGGAFTDTSDNNYRPGRLSGPRQSSDEQAMTTEGQRQEQEHNNTEGGEVHEDHNRTVEMIMEQVLGAEEDEPHSSLRSNTVHLTQPRPERMDIDLEAHEESVAEGLLILRIEGQTTVPIVAVEPHLERLGHTAATTGTDSDSLSFR